MKIILIGIFGMGGVYFRFMLDTYYKNASVLINPTLIANIIGSLIAGILYAYIVNKGSTPLTSALMIGLCGGLTTFSGFSLHAFKFLQDGMVSKSLAYLLLSPAIGLFMIFIGFHLANKLISQA